MKNKIITIVVGIALLMSVVGCAATSHQSGDSDVQLPNTEDARIAVTSTAVMEICRQMGMELVGVPESTLVEIPEEYEDATLIGAPMSPDLEILAQLNPDWVFSPVTLMSDLQPQYEAAGLNYAFFNLKSIEGMFQSIKEVGELFQMEEEAQVLIDDYETYIADFNERNDNQEGPTVLILMGLPGSYVVATPNSYVGNLVELAGGMNVYDDESLEFINVNTEDMLSKNPDMILRTAHATPEDVMEMFAEEFVENDIWKHFEAVKTEQVYDLPYEYFGMSATFDYKLGLEHLEEIFYE